MGEWIQAERGMRHASECIGQGSSGKQGMGRKAEDKALGARHRAPGMGHKAEGRRQMPEGRGRGST